jgi:hypothetical protein
MASSIRRPWSVMRGTLALVAMQNNKLLCDQCVEIDGIDFARRGGGGVVAGMRPLPINISVASSCGLSTVFSFGKGSGCWGLGTP